MPTQLWIIVGRHQKQFVRALQAELLHLAVQRNCLLDGCLLGRFREFSTNAPLAHSFAYQPNDLFTNPFAVGAGISRG